MSDDIGISVTDFDESSAMKPVLDMLGVQFDQIMEGCGFKRKAREVIRNSAVDGDGCLWLAENGTAIHYALEEPDCAGQMVQVPEELLGKRVILNPEESRLTPGCPIKEAPKQ